MPTIRETSQKPLLLTVTPVKYSLTDGTDIPPPPESPVKIPRPITPVRKIPGAFPESEVDEEEDHTKQDIMEPTSPPQQLPPQRGVRRLFSLNNLRTSFSSSRTSLALPRPSTDRPSTSHKHRPFTPSVSSTASTSPMQEGKTVRRRRSGWFKRKSSMFGLNSVDEDGQIDGRGNKRLKSSYSVPMLPDISELGGGELDGGDLGWDASAFSRAL